MSIRTLRMPTRSVHVIERNLVLFPHFWKVLAAGFVEPVFYLLGIGFGIGSLIRTIDMGGGHTVSYAVFVAAVCLVGVVLGVVESVMARLRMMLVPHVLTAAAVTAAFGFVLLVTMP